MPLNCSAGEDSRESLRGIPPAKRSNQSILKVISPGCSLEELMLKLKLPIVWPPHAKSWLIGKDSDAGSDWGQKEKGKTEDEMAGWHHWLDGHEFEWTPCVGDGQGGLACCTSWGCKESDMTEQLNWTEMVLLIEGERNIKDPMANSFFVNSFFFLLSPSPLSYHLPSFSLNLSFPLSLSHIHIHYAIFIISGVLN